MGSVAAPSRLEAAAIPAKKGASILALQNLGYKLSISSGFFLT